MGTNDLDQKYIRVNNGAGSLTAQVGKLNLVDSAQIFQTIAAISGGLPTQAEMFNANNSLNANCVTYVMATDPKQFDATDYMTSTRYIVYKEDRDPVGLGATAIRLSATILIYEIVKSTGNVS